MSNNNPKTLLSEIENRISLIEWDMPNIENEEVKKRKESELVSLRQQLAKLLDGQND